MPTPRRPPPPRSAGLSCWGIAVPARAYPATGSTQSGVFAGGAIGPLLFGATVERLGYPPAWRGLALAALLGAALILAGRRLPATDVRARAARPADAR